MRQVALAYNRYRPFLRDCSACLAAMPFIATL